MKTQLSSSSRISGVGIYPLFCTLVFFGLYFLFIFLWVDTRLVLYSHGQLTAWPIYVPGTGFFEGMPACPGKLSGFLAAYFSHYFGYAWMGALILTGLAWLLSLVTVKVVRGFGGGRFGGLGFVLPVIMLLQNGRYCHFLSDSIELLFALWFFWLYLRFPLQRVVLRLVVFFVLLGAVYVLAVPAYVIFLLLGVIYEFFVRRNLFAGMGGIILSLAVPLLLNGIYYGSTLSVAYFNIWFWSAYSELYTVDRILVYVFFLFLPGVCLGCVFVKRFRRKKSKVRRKDKGGRGRRGQRMSFWERYRGSRIKVLMPGLVFLIAVSGLVWLGSEHNRRRQMRIIYLARQENWHELLQEARYISGENYGENYSLFTCFYVNRALYHVGKLSSEMFSYPQHRDGLLLTQERRAGFGYLKRFFLLDSEIYYELGHINMSEHSCYEALALTYYCPWILQRLVLINIIKGQPAAAKIYLCKLQKDYLYCEWAQSYLERFEEDPSFSNDIEIINKRKSMIDSDSIKLASISDLFVPLLRVNRRNRMAYEYFMAFEMLAGNLETVISLFDQLTNLDMVDIPRHHQEAILLYTHMTGKKVDLRGRQIGADVVQRFVDFLRIYKSYQNNKRIAAEVLEKDFGDTYYYYYLFKMVTKSPPSVQGG